MGDLQSLMCRQATHLCDFTSPFLSLLNILVFKGFYPTRYALINVKPGTQSFEVNIYRSQQISEISKINQNF